MGAIEFEADLTAAVARLRPSVVSLRRYLNVRGRRGVFAAEGSGTGIVLDPSGLAITNHHVVRGARALTARLDNGQEVDAELLGSDPQTDLALVRLKASHLVAAEFADSERLRVGQFALAIGNSLGLPGGPSVSLGVVSALGRPLPGADYVLEGLIQTDAAINPGNSGGPLADLAGRIIGINAAMIPYAQGVGFAIPANTVQSIVGQIRSTGRVLRPWLGISGMALDAPGVPRAPGSPKHGVLLAEVAEDSPAAAAGLRVGDVLVRLGPTELHGLKDLLGALAKLPVGGTVDAVVLRGEARTRVLIRLAEAPAALEPA